MEEDNLFDKFLEAVSNLENKSDNFGVRVRTDWITASMYKHIDERGITVEEFVTEYFNGTNTEFKLDRD